MVTEKAAPGCLFCGSLLHCVFENCALHVSVREYVTPSGQWENGAEERVPGTVMQSALFVSFVFRGFYVYLHAKGLLC